MALVQLPDGTWVNPAKVWKVQALPALPPMENMGKRVQPRVVVNIDESLIILPCQDEEEANRVRDEIAESLKGA